MGYQILGPHQVSFQLSCPELGALLEYQRRWWLRQAQISWKCTRFMKSSVIRVTLKSNLKTNIFFLRKEIGRFLVNSVKVCVLRLKNSSRTIIFSKYVYSLLNRTIEKKMISRNIRLESIGFSMISPIIITQEKILYKKSEFIAFN